MVDSATQASAEVPTPSVRFLDNLVNFVSSLGTARDPTTNAHYSYQDLDRNTLEQAYRSDWIAQAVIDAPADDATREWRAWKASKNQIQSIEDFEKNIELRKKVKQWIIRARLYGGAALVIGVDDGKESWEELDLNAVEKGSLQFVVVLNRYELAAGPRIYNVSSRWYTRPEFYTVSTPLFGFHGEEGDFAPGASFAPQAVTPEYIRPQGQSSAGGGQNANVVRMSRGPAGGFGGDPYRRVAPYGGMVRLHPSRVMELAGHELPDWRLAPMGGGWGDSVLQVVDEALRDWGTLTGSIAAMTNDAKVDIVKLKDFTQRIGKQEYKTALLNRWMASNITKSTINALLLDQEEEWQRVQTSFGGLAELMREFMVTISGASKIPISRLFGQSAGRGLGAGSSGGEQDLKNYYDGVSSWQRNTVTPAMDYLDKVMVRSVLGAANKQIWYDWSPLYTMSDQEKATVAHLKAQTWQIDVQTGLINENVLRQARISQLLEDGTYPGLEDAIDEFGEEPDIPEARVWSPAMGIDPNTGLPVGGGGGGGSPPPPGGAPPPAPGGPPKGLPPGGATGGVAVAKPPGGPQNAVAKPAASGKGKTADADPFRDDFDESKHPRDPHGKFASGGSGGDVAGKGQKTHIVKQLLLQPGGTTLKEIKAKTGWTNVTVPGHAKIHGLELTKSKNAAGETVYKGTPSQSPDAAAAKQAAEPKPPVTAAAHVAAIAAAPKAEAPTLPGHQIQGFENADKWTKVGGKLGSNEGGTYKDANGQQWYVKTPPTADHAKNEVLTGKLYALAGAKVPETKLVGLGNKVSVASKIVGPSTELGQLAPTNQQVYSAAAQKDFAADAWLGNRDSVGTGKNNMVVSGGNLYRIDHGGGMKYRAMGSEKPFTSDPTEFHTLRDPAVNKDAADVFGKMTPQALKASIDKVGAVSNIDILKTVHSVYSGEEAKQIASTLMARKTALQGEGDKLAKLPEEKSTIMGTIAKAMGFGASEAKPAASSGHVIPADIEKYTPEFAAAVGMINKGTAYPGNYNTAMAKVQAAASGQATPAAAEAVLSSHEKQQIENTHGSVAVAYGKQQTALEAAQAPKSAPAAPAKAPQATQAELTKAAKTTPMPHGIAGSSPAAQSVVAEFNKKWAGKEITDPEQLNQKVAEYKEAVGKVAAHVAAAQPGKAAQPPIPEAEKTPEEHFKSLSGWSSSGIADAGKKAQNSPGTSMLSPLEAAHVQAYTGSTYQGVNKALRANSLTEAQHSFAKVLNGALGKMPNHVGIVNRGSYLDANELATYKPGMIHLEHGFTSTSTDPGKTFGGNTKFTIESLTGSHVKSLSTHPGEDEVLMPAHTFFRVTAHDIVGGNHYIHMKEVPK